MGSEFGLGDSDVCFCPRRPDLAALDREKRQPGDGEPVAFPPPDMPGLNDGISDPSAIPPDTSIRKARMDAITHREGEIKLYVVLVNFKDVRTLKHDDVNRFKQLFFSKQPGSVWHYYNEASNGRVDIVGKVVGPFDLPEEMRHYANGVSGSFKQEGDPDTRKMAADAASLVQTSRDADLRAYAGPDKKIGGFVIVHAGGGAESIANKTLMENSIWSCKWNLVRTADLSERKDRSVLLETFMTIPENAKLGVTVHELGHLLFGWPDFYAPPPPDPKKPRPRPKFPQEDVGHWCVMGCGSWATKTWATRNILERRGEWPAHPSAWCKYKSGWIDAVPDKENQRIVLKEVKKSNQARRLWTKGEWGPEYLLLENRARTGYDAGLPNDGLLIWRVCEDDVRHHSEDEPMLSLIRGHGAFVKGEDEQGDEGDPFPGASNTTSHIFKIPKNATSYDSAKTWLEVRNITAPDPTDDGAIGLSIAVVKPFQPVDPGRMPRSIIDGGAGPAAAGTELMGLAFDFGSSGKLDHLVFYRPGTGCIWITRSNPDGTFTQTDRLLAFDYTSSGKLDHLVAYRPGSGAFWVLKPDEGGKFKALVHIGAPGDGVGGYNLKSEDDRIIAFDYNSTGFQDHLALYRPGTGIFWILRNNGNGTFSPVYQQGNPGNLQGVSGHGIGGYDLVKREDRVFAFDYEKRGKADHLCIYRPGRGTFMIMKNVDGGTFKRVYNSEIDPSQNTDRGNGIGGYNLLDPADSNDYIALYRPGKGAIWVVGRNDDDNKWEPVFAEGAPGIGLPDFPLNNAKDTMFAFDYKSTGSVDCLVGYRSDSTDGALAFVEHP
ncbi:hypothetical protein QBC34DRAFT_493956 [Podospora aff. communis PSN243]|uniref:Peptidase M6-like domain-containing protein n=1 Tax=Podospora aff. communis PSN243 TaxID=3040156 RepID=A0AAV9GS41_9PEZI|nr:hypothetical protein QBC34DRAFT_493956 [Podospora aff. communis PSN243]